MEEENEELKREKINLEKNNNNNHILDEGLYLCVNEEEEEFETRKKNISIISPDLINSHEIDKFQFEIEKKKIR